MFYKPINSSCNRLYQELIIFGILLTLGYINTYSSFANILPSNWFGLAYLPIFFPAKIFLHMVYHEIMPELYMQTSSGESFHDIYMSICLLYIICKTDRCTYMHKIISPAVKSYNMDLFGFLCSAL